jgi:hypothetical protein
MPKKRTYDKLKVYDELRGRFQLCVADPRNPNKDVATVFGKQPNELRNAKLLCESWNAVVSVAERLGEDPLKVAKKLQRGAL